MKKRISEPAKSSSDTTPWTLLGSTTLEGKLGILVSWRYDGSLNGVQEDRCQVITLLRAIQVYMSGEGEKLSTADLLHLHDALASFPEEDLDIERVARDLFVRWEARIQ